MKISGKPYYRLIETGVHLGYRKGKAGGKWLMRSYAGKGRYQLESLGLADDRMDADGVAVLSFAQAQARVRERFVERNRLADDTHCSPYTVKQCVDDYLAWMSVHRKSATDARYKATAHIIPELGGTDCARLTPATVRNWHERLAEHGRRLRTKAGQRQRHKTVLKGDADTLRQRRASANRVLTLLKAALNYAWRENRVASDTAWRRVRPFPAVESARTVFLSIEQANKLIDAASPAFQNLIRGALYTGARYGELAAMTVGDFHLQSGTVHVRTSKSGKGRHIVLNAQGVALFRALTEERHAGDRIFERADEEPWAASQQLRPMKAACEKAKIELVGFHCLRHTYASHSVMNGAPLFVVAKNLGHADTRMVEKHYAHLTPSYVADAIRAAAPVFGEPEPLNAA